MISLIAWLERAFCSAHEVLLVLLLFTLKLLWDSERGHHREDTEDRAKGGKRLSVRDGSGCSEVVQSQGTGACRL